MRYVYELLVDFDGTTRSGFSSEGLFETQKLAEEHRKNLNLAWWQSSVINIRPVKGS